MCIRDRLKAVPVTTSRLLNGTQLVILIFRSLPPFSGHTMVDVWRKNSADVAIFLEFINFIWLVNTNILATFIKKIGIFRMKAV